MVEGVNSSVIYLIYCNNFCKCHNVPLPSTTIKNKINFAKYKIRELSPKDNLNDEIVMQLRLILNTHERCDIKDVDFWQVQENMHEFEDQLQYDKKNGKH
jgi:predicted ATP-dependent endonuclease of OLD family